MGDLSGLASVLAAANLSAAVLGALLATAIAFSPAGGGRRFALAALLLVLAYILAMMVGYQTGWIVEAPALIGTHSPLILLPGPLALLFARGYTLPERRWSLLMTLHFVPFLAYVIWLLPIYQAPVHVKIEHVLGAYYENTPAYRRTQFLHMCVGLAHVAGYFAVAGLSLRRIGALSGGLVRLIGSSLGLVWLVFAARFLLDAAGVSNTRETALAAHSSIALFLFVLAFASFRAGWAGLGTARRRRAPASTDPTLVAMGHDVVAALRTRRLYRDPELDLAALASAVGLTRHRASEALNKGLGTTFAAAVSDARIADVRSALDRGDPRSLTVIANEAGFASRTTFHEAFRRIVGETPGDYRRRCAVQSERTGQPDARDAAC